MTRPLVIVGAGGFGREVWSMLRAVDPRSTRWLVEGFVDDNPSVETQEAVEELGADIIGTTQHLRRRRDGRQVVLAIGCNSVRRRLVDELADSPVSYPAIVHPDSTIGARVLLGEGVVVAPGARLSTNISVGRHVHIDQNATVGHDTHIEDFARINPQACVSGSVTIGTCALIGANATVLEGLTVGVDATVGAGACVTKRVSDGTIVKGVPAR